MTAAFLACNARQYRNFPQAFSHFALIDTGYNFAAPGTAQQAAKRAIMRGSGRGCGEGREGIAKRIANE